MNTKEFRSLLRKECSLYSNHQRSSFLLLVLNDSDQCEYSDIPAIDLIRATFLRRGLKSSSGPLIEDNVGLLLPVPASKGEEDFINNTLADINKHFPLLALQLLCPPRSDGNDYVDNDDLTYIPSPETGLIPDDSTLSKYIALPTPRWKRLFDIVASLTALIILSPIMALAALIISLVSPGSSILFIQERVGFMGKPFMCWKFRTMNPESCPSSHRAHVTSLIRSREKMTKLDHNDDPRIIPFGNFLRHTAIDELPQLINVLKGEMSLIGPRPCIPYEYEVYSTWQKRRTEVDQGMTGLWQVSGKNETTFEEMVQLDIIYADKRSLWMDLKIIFNTPEVVIRQAMKLSMRKSHHSEMQTVKWSS